MGRKVELVTVPEWGARDRDKVFKLTEMPAAAAEKWALRAVIALKGTAGQIPDALAPLGMVAVAIRGINAFLASDVDFAKMEPLLDEMMTCVQIVRDPKARDAEGNAIAGNIVSGDDIEEVRTIAWLRSEVLRLHTNFSFIEAALDWVSRMKSPEQADSLTT